MTKKEVSKILASGGYHAIPHTWFKSDEGSYIVRTYDNVGLIHEWWICPKFRAAKRTMLSTTCLNSDHDVSYMFFA